MVTIDNFKGIWIPKELWLNNDLTIVEKILLVEIYSLESDKKGCYASNKFFAKFFNLSTGRISQMINSLKDRKYISIDYSYNGNEIKERNIRITEKIIDILKVSKEESKQEISKEDIEISKFNWLED